MSDNLTSKEYTPEELKNAFLKLYGGNEADVKLYSSPARINIIGEHIDYNGGKVFPASINRYLYMNLILTRLSFLTRQMIMQIISTEFFSSSKNVDLSLTADLRF